jgi:membrane fusion protein (multidrug efflux system)
MEKEIITTEAKKMKTKKIILIVSLSIIVVLAIAAKMGYNAWSHESTDDAQIDGNIIPLKTTVTGFVKEIRFKENQEVKKGDTLIVFDTTDLLAQINQSKAQLAAAWSDLETSKDQVAASCFNQNAATFNTGSAKDNIGAASAKAWEAERNYKRISGMFIKGAATQQSLDNAKTSFDVAKSQLAAARQQYCAAGEQKKTIGSEVSVHHSQIKSALAKIRQVESQLVLVKNQYDHAFVIAPCDGVISKKNVESGQFVASGSPLASLIDVSDVWVTANFKETQLNDIVPGQSVNIQIDAYHGKTVPGIVQSFCGAAGTKFSILPAENATGNFIKVTQRIPVRIAILKDKNWKKPLLPGMSVVVAVKTR